MRLIWQRLPGEPGAVKVSRPLHGSPQWRTLVALPLALGSPGAEHARTTTSPQSTMRPIPPFLACLSLLACSGDSQGPSTFVPPPTVAGIAIVSGNLQEGRVGQELPEQIVVVVFDDRDRAVAGATVTFDVRLGGGSVVTEQATTDGSGRASTRWILGPSVDEAQNLLALTPNGSSSFALVFVATLVPGAPAVLEKIQGDNQSVTPSTILPDSLTVRVLDESQNPVAGVTVNWTPGVGGGTASPASSLTDSQGLASTEWTVGPAGVTLQTLTASALQLGEGVFNATVAEPGTQWERLPDLPQAVRAPAVTNDGAFVYVIGGTTTEGVGSQLLQIFDPSTNTWTMGADVPVDPGFEIDFAMAGALSDGIHLVGGSTRFFGEIDRHLVYDRNSDIWTEAPPIPEIVDAAAFAVFGDRLYILGGNRGVQGGAVGGVWIFDSSTGEWTSGTPMLTARFSAGTAVFGGEIWVSGGQTGIPASDLVEVYDPTANSWRTSLPMPSARTAHGGGVFDGRPCVFGGLPNAAVCWDEPSGSWVGMPSLSVPRTQLGATTLDGAVYAIGGIDQNPSAVVERIGPVGGLGISRR